MKKFISKCTVLILLVTLVINSSSFTVLAESEFDERTDLLHALKILNDKQIVSSDTVTRGEAAKLLYNIYVGGETTAEGLTAEVFSDVKQNSEYAKPVAILYGAGIFNGVPGGLFRPYEDITYEQLAKSLVILCGYDYIAMQRGGYPNGYLETAFELKMFKDVEVNYSYPVQYGVLLKIIENILEIPIMVTTAQGTYTDGYRTTLSEYTVLSHYLGINTTVGTVTKAGMINLLNEHSANDDTVVIDGVVYHSELDLTEVLGHRLKVYYEPEENEIFYYRYIDKYNDIVEFDCDDIKSFGDRKYVAKDIKEEYQLATNAYVIYNNESLSNYTSADLFPPEGKIKLVDNNRDGIYDCVTVTATTTMVIETVDYINKVVAGTEGEILDFNGVALKQDPKIISNGEFIKFEQLSSNNVLSYAFSKSKKHLTVYVATEVVQGAVTATEISGDERYITIDDEYCIVKKTELLDSVAVGDKGVFYKDYKGKIVYFKKQINHYNLGYLIDGAKTSDIADDITLKIFSDNGEFLYLEVYKNIIINSKKCNLNTCLTELSFDDDGVTPQIIMYKVNADNKVTEIDTAYNKFNNEDYTEVAVPSDEEASSLRVSYSSFMEPTISQKQLFVAGINTFGIVKAENSTPVFVIPETPKTAVVQEFSISTVASSFVGAAQYDIETYAFGDNDMVVNAVVIPKSTSNAINYEFGVIESIVLGINNDGDSGYKITVRGLNGTSEIYSQSLQATADGGTVNYTAMVGDVIKYNVDTKGWVDLFAIMYSTQADDYVAASNPSSQFITAAKRVYYGQLYEKNDNLLMMTTINLTATNGAVAIGEKEIHVVDNYTVYSVDKDSRKVLEVDSPARLKDYKTYGNECSKVCIYTSYGTRGMMVIYE